MDRGVFRKFVCPSSGWFCPNAPRHPNQHDFWKRSVYMDTRKRLKHKQHVKQTKTFQISKSFFFFRGEKNRNWCFYALHNDPPPPPLDRRGIERRREVWEGGELNTFQSPTESPAVACAVHSYTHTNCDTKNPQIGRLIYENQKNICKLAKKDLSK